MPDIGRTANPQTRERQNPNQADTPTEPADGRGTRVRLACPACRGLLAEEKNSLACVSGHRYPVIGGIPILLDPAREANHKRHWEETRSALKGDGDLTSEGRAPGSELSPPPQVDPYVRKSLVETHGLMYRTSASRVVTYPIPEVDLPPGEGRLLLDIGCNWGRWSIAAARRGYSVVGLDPSIEAIRAARRVSSQLNQDITFVVGDARCLPFPDSEFSLVYSYSVLQHFATDDLLVTLSDVHRVLQPSGAAVIEMLSSTGPRALMNQVRRGFRAARDFEVRYYSQAQLKEIFEANLGPSTIRVDGFLSANPQATDLKLLPARFRAVVHTSEMLKRLVQRVPVLGVLADSVFIISSREETPKSRSKNGTEDNGRRTTG